MVVSLRAIFFSLGQLEIKSNRKMDLKERVKSVILIFERTVSRAEPDTFSWKYFVTFRNSRLS